jgi:hypothetical protein
LPSITQQAEGTSRPPDLRPEEMVLTVAFRLVASRLVPHPALLLELDPDLFRHGVDNLKLEPSAGDRLSAAHEWLEREWGQFRPSPLWMAWMEETRGGKLRQVIAALESGKGRS